MAKTIAGWYSLLLGAALAAVPFAVLGRAGSAEPETHLRTIALVVAGLLLAGGGAARLMRLPGRVASLYLGVGAGLIALIQTMAALVAMGAPEWELAVVGVAIVGLVIASWAQWPSN